MLPRIHVQGHEERSNTFLNQLTRSKVPRNISSKLGLSRKADPKGGNFNEVGKKGVKSPFDVYLHFR